MTKRSTPSPAQKRNWRKLIILTAFVGALAACDVVPDGNTEVDTSTVTNTTPTPQPTPTPEDLLLSPRSVAVSPEEATQQRANQFSTATCYPEDGFAPIESYLENGCLTPKEQVEGAHVLLFGDGFAAQYSGALRQMADKQGWTVSQITVPSCTPVLQAQSSDECKAHNQAVVDLVTSRRDVDLVVMAGGYFDHRNTRIWIGRTIEALEKAGSNVVVLGPHVRYDETVPKLLAEYVTESGRINPELFSHLNQAVFDNSRAFEEQLTSLQPAYFQLTDATQYVSMTRLLCPDEDICRLSANGKLAYRNKTMFTPEGAEWVVEQLSDKLTAAVD